MLLRQAAAVLPPMRMLPLRLWALLLRLPLLVLLLVLVRWPPRRIEEGRQRPVRLQVVDREDASERGRLRLPHLFRSSSSNRLRLPRRVCPPPFCSVPTLGLLREEAMLTTTMTVVQSDNGRALRAKLRRRPFQVCFPRLQEEQRTLVEVAFDCMQIMKNCSMKKMMC